MIYKSVHSHLWMRNKCGYYYITSSRVNLYEISTYKSSWSWDSSSLSFRPSNESTNNNSSSSECEGAQTFLFEPYDSEFTRLGYWLDKRQLKLVRREVTRAIADRSVFRHRSFITSQGERGKGFGGGVRFSTRLDFGGSIL